LFKIKVLFDNQISDLKDLSDGHLFVDTIRKTFTSYQLFHEQPYANIQHFFQSNNIYNNLF
jgi:hypothetical protein